MSLELSVPSSPSLAPLPETHFFATSRPSLHNNSPTIVSTDTASEPPTTRGADLPHGSPNFVERRQSNESNRSVERRQFGSSHANLSPAAAELALAIDQYKLEHRRRYITCEEMLMVINQLGYHR